MRRGQWWWAGVYGLFASLTRSAGLLLLLPFAYEYLRQHEFRYRKLGFDALSCILIIAGTGLFALYCALRFHDPLAFAHAQAYWGRQITLPGIGFARTLWVIRHNGLLSFSAIHGAIDLARDCLCCCLRYYASSDPGSFVPINWPIVSMLLLCIFFSFYFQARMYRFSHSHDKCLRSFQRLSSWQC